MNKASSILLPRRWVQTLSLLVLHSNFAQWLGLMNVCNPVMSCHACPLAWCYCPIGVFSHFTHWGLMVGIFPWLAVGSFVLIGTLIGRLLCGWVCPFGFLQDLLHKIPGPKAKLPKWADLVKYPVLIGSVFVLPALWGVEISFCTVCPTSFLQVSIPSIFTSAEFTLSASFLLKGGITLAVIVFSIIYSRFFCRVLCPIGALLAVFNLLCFWRVEPATSGCVSCGKCDRICPTDAHPAERILVGTPANRAAECIACHDCQPACPVAKKGG